jgi:hypothetical protein
MRCITTMLPLALVGCGYTAPLDTGAEPVRNAIHGHVTFAGPDRPDAPVFVALYAADNPPPPTGTGRPITFTTVPSSDFTGDAAGIQSAPYALTELDDGDYLVSALMDVDGDFHPLVNSNAGSSCGDWLGGHVTDLVSGIPGVVSVAGGQLVDDVAVFVVAENQLERPAFKIGDNEVLRTDSADWQFTIEATGIQSALTQLDGPFEGAAEDVYGACETTFMVHIVDADGDGSVDPHWLVADMEEPPAGAYAIWPRLYITYDPLGQDDSLAEGEAWLAEVFVFPDFLFAGEIPLSTPTPRNTLTGQYAGQVLHRLPDGTEEIVSGEDVPAGDWGLTVVAETGQTWTVPNATATAPSLGGDFVPGTQGAVLRFQ